MNVEQLIEYLKNFPRDLEVAHYIGNGAYSILRTTSFKIDYLSPPKDGYLMGDLTKSGTVWCKDFPSNNQSKDYLTI